MTTSARLYRVGALTQLLLFAVLVVGCTRGTEQRTDAPEKAPPEEAKAVEPAAVPAEDLKAVADGNQAFAFDLFAQLRQQPGNIFISPYSISSALAMTYAGARGQTADEMPRCFVSRSRRSASIPRLLA